MWTILALTLFGTHAASAQSDASCELYCTDAANRHEVECGKDKTCLSDVDLAFDACLADCPVVVKIPPYQDLVDLGVKAAEYLVGAPVHLLEDQLYLHPDGGDNSVLVVVSTDPADDPSSIRASIAKGKDPAIWDDTLIGIEVGAREEHPPVVSWWTGVPFEYLLDERVEAHTLATYGTSTSKLIRRHGSPVFPVFEYDVAGTTVFFDPRGNEFAEKVTAHVNTDLRASDAWLLHVERTRRQWRAFLDGSWFVDPKEVK